MRTSVAVAVLFLVSACDTRVPGTGCKSNQDCLNEGITDAVCVDAVCIERCSNDNPCPAGEVCQDGRCRAQGEPCTRHEDCATCKACRDGRCLPQGADEDLKDECAEGPCLTGLCDGAGACGFAPVGTVCREAAGACDVAEVCPGDGPVCPDDGFLPPSHVCRDASGECDQPESCTGTGPECPEDQFKPATTVCRAAVDECDRAEMCSGTSASCGADLKAAEGTQCGLESCSGTLYTSGRSCDGTGVCREATVIDCAPYLCGENACRTACESNAECATGYCDLESRACAEDVIEVDCSTAPGALQAAIDACVPGVTCYLRARGTCDKLTIENRSVYIDGGQSCVVRPSSPGPAVTILENDGTTDQTTSVVLSGISVLGAMGQNAHGIEVIGIRNGAPKLTLRSAVIGGPASGENNSGLGLSAQNSTVSLVDSTIQNNTGIGLRVTNGDCLNCLAALERSRIIANAHGGIELSKTSFRVTNTVIAANGVSLSAQVGGVLVVQPGSTRVFAHNTVSKNGILGNSGIECLGSGGFPIVNSIVWANGKQAEGDEVVGCGTSLPGSHIEGSPAQACGEGADPSLSDDFHLDASSPCIDAAPDCAGLTIDIDGDPRPQHPGAQCDVGADEVR
jgi:hypothetical protein